MKPDKKHETSCIIVVSAALTPLMPFSHSTIYSVFTASGGYYLALACDAIVAEELTLTGSIGVVLAKFNIQGLLQKLGEHYFGIIYWYFTIYQYSYVDFIGLKYIEQSILYFCFIIITPHSRQESTRRLSQSVDTPR